MLPAFNHVSRLSDTSPTQRNLGVHVRPEAPPSELAVAVARHFESMDVDEEECIGGFLERLEAGPNASTKYSRKTQRHINPGDPFLAGKKPGPIPKSKKSAASQAAIAQQIAQRQSRIKRTKWAARPGEQVAAKVTRTDENGSWILASVQRFYADTETYDVQDEDDTSKLIRLPFSHVMRLSTGSEGCFSKGASCMAIFPETTSFYKSTVARAPVWKVEHGAPVVKEIIVKFEDDEDAQGKTPQRRVPSRYVIPVPSVYFYDEQEDVDLVPPGTATTTTTTTTKSTTSFTPGQIGNTATVTTYTTTTTRPNGRNNSK
jgi:SAGA-associated factor 29